MAIILPDARQLSDEVLDALRLRVLNGRELGLTETDLADLLRHFPGDGLPLVVRLHRSRGSTHCLTIGPDAPLGTGRLISDEQAHRVQRLLDEKNPDELSIPAPLWNRHGPVRELIRQECRLLLAVRTVGKYLKRWGYTAKKPSRRAKKQDPGEIRQWLEGTYPAIEKRAAEEDAEIYFCDETGANA